MTTNLPAALARAKERAQGQATSADDAYLTELLTLSAGTDSSAVTHYRPYLVAAKFLEQRLAAQTFSEADGAKFTGLALPIASLLRLQAAYDTANDLAIPEGFEAIPAEPSRFRSRAIARTPSP